jgi:adenosine deaminase
VDLATLKRLPKVELHRHLEGSLRPETLWEFHQREKQQRHASLDALKSAYTLPRGTAPGFRAYLSRFDALHFRFGGEDAIERLAFEAVEDAAGDGVVHIELRFSPVGFARRMIVNWNEAPAFTRVDEVVSATHAVLRGARAAARRAGITVSFIATIGRHFGVAVNRPTAELIGHEIGAEFCGLDLAGIESHPAAEYAGVLRAWRDAGRGLSVHAGEDPADKGAANVREAVTDLGATRIGHGARAIEDEKVVAELASKKVPLELCLTSNTGSRRCRRDAEHRQPRDQRSGAER